MNTLVVVVEELKRWYYEVGVVERLKRWYYEVDYSVDYSLTHHVCQGLKQWEWWWTMAME